MKVSCAYCSTRIDLLGSRRIQGMVSCQACHPRLLPPKASGSGRNEGVLQWRTCCACCSRVPQLGSRLIDRKRYCAACAGEPKARCQRQVNVEARVQKHLEYAGRTTYHEISLELGIPARSVRKVLAQLVDGDIVRRHTGAYGGCRGQAPTNFELTPAGRAKLEQQ
jgi:hypothetical protein